MQTSEPRQMMATTSAQVKQLLKEGGGYDATFKSMLKERAPQFISSIIACSNRLPAGTDPHSIIGAAAIAATLDLPIDPNLGFAHIVPYKGKATFQMGYKGFVQLGLRSGQYSRMNAQPINAEAFNGYDEVGDPLIDWNKLDKTKEAIGYAFAWKLVNGFTKVVYWTREAVVAHAERYSQAYRSKKQDSPWFTKFDSMALKTVIKDGLGHWGILSTQMQTAMRFDQASVPDLGADPEYIDVEEDHRPQIPAKAKAANPYAAGKRKRAPEPQPEPTPEPPQGTDGDLGPEEPTPHQALSMLCEDNHIAFDDLRDFMGAKQLIRDPGSISSIEDIPAESIIQLQGNARWVGELVKNFGKPE